MTTLNNINLSYNPDTGVNYPFTDISRRPFPDWGVVSMNVMGGRSNSHSLQTGFTKRLSQRWQASGTYTLSWLYDQSAPAVSGVTPVPFPVAPDLGGEYTIGATDQRHRATFNGIWQVGRGLQLSGLYFFGSGQRYATSYGGDLRLCGQGCDRLRPNGTIVPRTNLTGDPIHRVDLRLQQRIRFGRVALDGMLEAYNLFNHENYGSYEVREGNANYGKPLPLLSLVYATNAAVGVPNHLLNRAREARQASAVNQPRARSRTTGIKSPWLVRPGEARRRRDTEKTIRQVSARPWSGQGRTLRITHRTPVHVNPSTGEPVNRNLSAGAPMQP